MNFPFQCLVARAESGGQSSTWTLFGASGSKIVVQSSDGKTSVWSQDVASTEGNQEEEQQEPPRKRIKLSTPPQKPQEKHYNFSNLILSSNGKHLVGVTGEDKCIRVFEITAACGLQQLSARCMSRRPSSITLTSDNATILCADKFGDVYALPLLPSPEDLHVEATEPANVEPEDKDFTPSATVLTVHSGRNRKTLEDQLKQKAKQAKTKETISFRHDLLLGHVSMLTDLAFTSVEGRNYIITADRDEHIRVSRGLPQAHIIEGFCFGHEEFVSKLCVTRSGKLVSGGGDPQLFVWDWQNYRLLEKLALRETVSQHMKTRTEVGAFLKDDKTLRVAVSGIWEVPGDNGGMDEMLVACEGLPALFHFSLGTSATLGAPLPLNGNALDVAFLPSNQGSNTIIVSIDNVHQPGSTTELRKETDAPRLQHFTRQADGQWSEDVKLEASLGPFIEQGSMVDRGSSDGASLVTSDNKAARDILYHVENLRKRPGSDD